MIGLFLFFMEVILQILCDAFQDSEGQVIFCVMDIERFTLVSYVDLTGAVPGRIFDIYSDKRLLLYRFVPDQQLLILPSPKAQVKTTGRAPQIVRSFFYVYSSSILSGHAARRGGSTYFPNLWFRTILRKVYHRFLINQVGQGTVLRFRMREPECEPWNRPLFHINAHLMNCSRFDSYIRNVLNNQNILSRGYCPRQNRRL